MSCKLEPAAMRSLLFVPGDRPDRFGKAAASGADVVILDLEDSVAAGHKAQARAAVADWLAADRQAPVIVRVNPLDSEYLADDLACLAAHPPEAVMLPKAEGAASIEALLARMDGWRVPVLPVATETAAAVFQLGSYSIVSSDLIGLTWGAEDLPAAIGATSSRHGDGSFTDPYRMVRSLALFAAHAAGVTAVETIFPDIADAAGLDSYVAAARREGFTAMMAIHPGQVAAINRGFTPSADDVAHARKIVDAFAAAPDSGALQLDGKMIDRPHHRQALAVLARAGIN